VPGQALVPGQAPVREQAPVRVRRLAQARVSAPLPGWGRGLPRERAPGPARPMAPLRSA